MYRYELDHNKTEQWRTDALNCGVGEDSWESLGQEGEQPVNPKGNQSWIFTRRTDAKAEIPILWPPEMKNWLIWKDPDAWRDWRQEEKGMTGWDGWMASPTRRTGVWASSRSWWWTGKLGMLQSMGSTKSQTWLNDWTKLNLCISRRILHQWATRVDQDSKWG